MSTSTSKSPSSASRLNLARKYRPKLLSELVGQEAVTSILQKALEQDQIAPAYLLSGPRGVGKTSAARIFARAASCWAESLQKRPCGECRSCLAIREGQSMDIIEIDGASHTGVDDVRQIIESVAYRPSTGKRNVYIIDEVHMLSTAAFNALLKTLEEPPSHALFLFATTEPERLPSTILSRVQRLELRRLSEKVIFENLKSISEIEKFNVQDETLEQIAAAADGALRDAQTLLEQMRLLSGSEGVQHELVDQFLGTVGIEQEIQLLEFCAQRNLDEILNRLWLYHDKGKDLAKLSARLWHWIRCVLLGRAMQKPDLLFKEITPESFSRLSEAFQHWSLDDLDRLFEVFSETNDKMKRSGSPRISLESGFIRASRLAHTEDVQTLISLLRNQKSAQQSITQIESRIENTPPPSHSVKSRAPSPTAPGKIEEKTLPENLNSSEDIMAAFKTHKASAYGLLRCAHSMEAHDSTWKLKFPRAHFAIKSLRDPLLLKELESFLQKISSLKSIELIEEGEDQHRKDVLKRDFIKEAKKEILQDDLIHKALGKIQGEVESVTIEGIKT